METRLAGELRMPEGVAEVEMAVSLEVVHTPAPEIALQLQVSLPCGIRLIAGGLLEKKWVLESLARLEEVAAGSAPASARIEPYEPSIFLLQFDAIPGEAGRAAVSGEFREHVAGTPHGPAAAGLAHLRLGPAKLYMAFQWLIIPQPEVQKMASLLRAFLDAYGEQLPLTVEDWGEEGRAQTPPDTPTRQPGAEDTSATPRRRRGRTHRRPRAW